MIGASLTVVVPCFNEAEIIQEAHRSLVESLAAVCESLEFVYVDDGSVDATLDLLRELCQADPRVKVVLYLTRIEFVRPWGVHEAVWSLAANFVATWAVSRFTRPPSSETVERIHGEVERFVYGDGAT